MFGLYSSNIAHSMLTPKPDGKFSLSWNLICASLYAALKYLSLSVVPVVSSTNESITTSDPLDASITSTSTVPAPAPVVFAKYPANVNLAGTV